VVGKMVKGLLKDSGFYVDYYQVLVGRVPAGMAWSQGKIARRFTRMS
jgi:hypothetical protein